MKKFILIICSIIAIHTSNALILELGAIFKKTPDNTSVNYDVGISAKIDGEPIRLTKYNNYLVIISQRNFNLDSKIIINVSWYKKYTDNKEPEKVEVFYYTPSRYLGKNKFIINTSCFGILFFEGEFWSSN